MSHKINTTISLPRTDRDIKRALKKYFEPGSYDLSYQAVLPPPSGLRGEQLMVWKSEHWGSRPFACESEIKDNKLKFYTVNGIPKGVYAALAKRLQTPVLVTTESTDDMEWTQIEIHPDGRCRVIYSANETQSRGPVPPSIRQFISTYRVFSEPKESATTVPTEGLRKKLKAERVGEPVPF